MMMMMMKNCFWGMVDRRKAFNLISSLDHCHRSSPSRISNTTWVAFEPAQNLSSGFVEWSCVAVIITTPRCHSIPTVCSGWVGRGRGWTSIQIFQKGRGLTGSQFLEGGCLERKDELFQGKLQFLYKKKLKSETFKDKKSLWTTMFFSVTSKNLNWEILTKNLVNFKIWYGVKD